MESETIDLTDPLERLLRETGWTPKYLQERLMKLTAGKTSDNILNSNNSTLHELLRNFPCGNSDENKGVEASETIELSDDDVSIIASNEKENEAEGVTEVRVIEINEGSSNEDDDYEFFNDGELLTGKQNINTNNMIATSQDKNIFQSEDTYINSLIQKELFLGNNIEDLGFKVTHIQGGINLIDSSIQQPPKLYSRKKPDDISKELNMCSSHVTCGNSNYENISLRGDVNQTELQKLADTNARKEFCSKQVDESNSYFRKESAESNSKESELDMSSRFELHNQDKNISKLMRTAQHTEGEKCISSTASQKTSRTLNSEDEYTILLLKNLDEAIESCDTTSTLHSSSSSIYLQKRNQLTEVNTESSISVRTSKLAKTVSLSIEDSLDQQRLVNRNKHEVHTDAPCRISDKNRKKIVEKGIELNSVEVILLNKSNENDLKSYVHEDSGNINSIGPIKEETSTNNVANIEFSLIESHSLLKDTLPTEETKTGSINSVIKYIDRNSSENLVKESATEFTQGAVVGKNYTNKSSYVKKSIISTNQENAAKEKLDSNVNLTKGNITKGTKQITYNQTKNETRDCVEAELSESKHQIAVTESTNDNIFETFLSNTESRSRPDSCDALTITRRTTTDKSENDSNYLNTGEKINPPPDTKNNSIEYDDTGLKLNLSENILIAKPPIGSSQTNNNAVLILQESSNAIDLSYELELPPLNNEKSLNTMNKSHTNQNTLTIPKEHCKQSADMILKDIISIEHNYGNESKETNEITQKENSHDIFDYNEPPRDNLNVSDEAHLSEEHNESNLEEIRKNLKLQLLKLRNKKGMNILQDVKEKINFSSSITCPKKCLDGSSISTTNTLEGTSKKEKTNEKQQIMRTDIICSKTEQPEYHLEKHEDEELPNVLMEIRNIIRKPRSALKITITNSSKNTEKDSSKYMENLVSMTSKSIDIDKNEEIQTLEADIPENRLITSDNVVNSPFISNTLDKFLTDAKLNVSYTIPKSGAEEGLIQNYSEIPIVPPIVSEVKEENIGKSTQENKYKPKTLAEKRRLLEKIKLKNKKQKEKLKKLEEHQNRSYVLYKDKKILVKTKKPGKCVASIDSTIIMNSSNESFTPRKRSLLTELYKKNSTPLLYKPGPLCRKHLLQTDYSNWSTELKTLPRVVLEVMPEVGKPVSPTLLHILPVWDGEVSENQIEFALSALFTKEDQKQNRWFKFNVPYKNNQTQILTRKKIVEKSVFGLDHPKKEVFGSENDVAHVIEKLLDYVEIKEIASSLIKEDDFTHTTLVEDIATITKKPRIDNHVLVKRKSRITKTNRELLRLNCKVVSVEVEDNEPEKICSKSYCRLGCVCNSLKCERIIGLHCQKFKCIFGCKCPKEKDNIVGIAEPIIKLPAGTDLLSTATVSRIEGEAKKNLARVEKEFTQTVIHTNDKTIVVGFGNKPRRVIKVNKKYINNFFEEEASQNEIRESKRGQTIPMKNCSVYLNKWNFSDIIPYCLVHHLYNCYCRGLSTVSSNTNTNRKKEKYTVVKDQEFKKRGKLSAEESFKAIVRNSASLGNNPFKETDDEEILYSVSGRPIRKKKKTYKGDSIFEDNNSVSIELPKLDNSVQISRTLKVVGESNCSRTQAIDAKHIKVKTFNRTELTNDFENNLTQADLVKAQIQNKHEVSDADRLKTYLIDSVNNKSDGIKSEIHKKKRKQVIEVRGDEDIIINSIPSSKPSYKQKVKSVFKGEIIVNDSEWLKKMGQTSKQLRGGYARILPWTAFLKGFLSNSLNVYCLLDTPLKLLLNVGPKLTGDKIMDVETNGYNIIHSNLKSKSAWCIKQSENVKDIIRWLMSGILPAKYEGVGLSFLLVETLPDRFEIRGLCTQEDNKPDISNNQINVLGDGNLSDPIIEVKHKDMNKDLRSIFVKKAKFHLRELMEDGVEDDMSDNLYMWAGLPEVYKLAKWRVILLKNDFAYLHFKKIKYSIKYTDLSKLTRMAKDEMVTLILRNGQIIRSYDHALFGLYISHHHSDRIFIGPYFVNYDEDDVETLRYINQSLVSSESLNKMTGNPNHRCGHWMYERKYYHKRTVYIKDTIDLTKEEVSKPFNKESTIQSVSSSSRSMISPNFTAQRSVQTASNKDHIIYYNGIPIYIKNSRPKKPSEFNRFIMTNIPHFGYLGAYQPDNSTKLEVSWPFERKVLEFHNADVARDFLQERFHQLLQPVPESFRIQVIVLLQLDLSEHQPINSNVLSGHCICGYFGTYNFRELTPEFCLEKLSITKDEITKLFVKRAHTYIKKKIEELAELVGINSEDPGGYNVYTILNKAKEEIHKQELYRKNVVSEIQSYELKVASNLKVLHKLVNSLPIKERNIESKIINEILQIRPKRLGATEVVEIVDDDNELQEPNKTGPDKIVNFVDSDKYQSVKIPMKRKVVTVGQPAVSAKVAKVAPYIGPTKKSFSILKAKPQTSVSPSIQIPSKGGKPKIILVRPSQRPVINVDDKKLCLVEKESKVENKRDIGNEIDHSNIFMEYDQSGSITNIKHVISIQKTKNPTETSTIIPVETITPSHSQIDSIHPEGGVPPSNKTYSKKTDSASLTNLIEKTDILK